MAEETGLIKGSEFTTVSDYDPAVKAKAYSLYLSSDYNIADIAIALGVGKQVVSGWATSGGWHKRKLELEREEMLKAEDQYRQVILANRAPVAAQHIRISGKIEEIVELFADKLKTGDGLTGSEMAEISKLKQLAEALTGASGVRARAVGISDRPSTDPIGDQDENGKKKKQPLIIIGVTAQPSPGFKEPVEITVTESEI